MSRHFHAFLGLLAISLLACAGGTAEAKDRKNGTNHWAWVHNSARVDLAYVLVRGETEGVHGSGNGDDFEEAKQIRSRYGPNFLWVRQGDRRYVIRDPKTVESAWGSFEPVVKLGKEQGRIGREQARLGTHQAAIGRKQARIGKKQGELGRRIGRLASEIEDGRQIGRSVDELEREHDSIEEEMDRLSEQQEELQHQQESWARKQEPLSERQETLGAQQEKLSRELERKMKDLIEGAIESGQAQRI